MIERQPVCGAIVGGENPEEFGHLDTRWCGASTRGGCLRAKFERLGYENITDGGFCAIDTLPNDGQETPEQESQ